VAADGLRVHVSDLLRHPGARREHRALVVVPDLAVSTTTARPEVELDLVLESLVAGLLATGHVRARWDAECVRCLDPVHGVLDVEIRELFEPAPTEGESYPLGTEVVDLEPMVRDAVVLDLPLAPRHDEGACDPDVVAVLDEAPDPVPDDADGDDPSPPADPRWAALRELEF
jgi:uncharacterized protein